MSTTSLSAAGSTPPVSLGVSSSWKDLRRLMLVLKNATCWNSASASSKSGLRISWSSLKFKSTLARPNSLAGREAAAAGRYKRPSSCRASVTLKEYVLHSVGELQLNEARLQPDGCVGRRRCRDLDALQAADEMVEENSHGRRVLQLLLLLFPEERDKFVAAGHFVEEVGRQTVPISATALR